MILDAGSKNTIIFIGNILHPVISNVSAIPLGERCFSWISWRKSIFTDLYCDLDPCNYIWAHHIIKILLPKKISMYFFDFFTCRILSIISIYPPFPILSQFFCFLVLSVKVIEIIFWHKRVKNNAPNQGIQILLEFLVMTSILITTFFCWMTTL